MLRNNCKAPGLQQICGKALSLLLLVLFLSLPIMTRVYWAYYLSSSILKAQEKHLSVWLSQWPWPMRWSRTQEARLRASQLWHHWYLGWDKLWLWELSWVLREAQHIPGLHTLDASSVPADMATCPLGDKIATTENHWSDTRISALSHLALWPTSFLDPTGSFPPSLRENSGHTSTSGERTHQNSLWAIPPDRAYLLHPSFKNKLHRIVWHFQ